MLRARDLTKAFICAGALSVLSICVSAALAQSGQSPPKVELLSSGPIPELRFHGMQLRNVRADDAQNEVSLSFEGAIDPAVFDELERDLPDWVEKSYAGYDSAVIRTRQPATFMTRREGDGFSLRIMARGPVQQQGATAAPSSLRGPMGDAQTGGNLINEHLAPGPYETAPLPPADYELRGSIDTNSRYYAQNLARHPRSLSLQQASDRANAGSGSYIAGGSTYYRTPDRDTLVASNLRGKLEVGGGVSLIGSVDDTWAKGSAVRQLSGTRTAFTRNVVTGAAGLALDSDEGELRGEALFGQSGVGARIAGYSGTASGYWRTAFEWKAPELSSTEAVAAKATHDRFELGFAQILSDGVWGSITGRATRYGVSGDPDIARTAGFSANLEFTANVENVLAGLYYDGEGEYVVDHDIYAGPPAFTPLSIRDREIHQGGLTFTFPIIQDLWFDLDGGYAYERFAKKGGWFGGAGLRYALAQGANLNLSVRHTEISTNIGPVGPETTASLSLTLALDNMHLGLPSF